MPEIYKVLKEAAIQIGSGGSAGTLYTDIYNPAAL